MDWPRWPGLRAPTVAPGGHHPSWCGWLRALALRRPRPSVATIWRHAVQAAGGHDWPAPSYSTVHAIVADIDPHLVTLAHEGSGALRDRYELVYRRQAEHPNVVWQADHTELDLLVLDADGKPARPWLTVVLDDCSRAIAGYSLFLGAPSTLNLSLALRQAIWRKNDPSWVVHGLPEVLYVDHGSDFTSHHLTAVAADLHIELGHSAVARPQGRGKIEHFFGTLTTELLPQLPGQLVRGHPAPAAGLTLAEADAAIGAWISGVYHQRPHGETGTPPQHRHDGSAAMVDVKSGRTHEKPDVAGAAHGHTSHVSSAWHANIQTVTDWQLMADVGTAATALGALGLSLYTFFDRRKDPARDKQRQTRSDVRALVAAVRAEVAAAETVASDTSGDGPAQLFTKHRAAFSDLDGRIANPQLARHLQWVEITLADVDIAAEFLRQGLRERQREQPLLSDQDPAVTIAVATTELRQAKKAFDDQVHTLTKMLNDIERRHG